MKYIELTREDIEQVVSYNPITGVFIRKSNNQPVNLECFKDLTTPKIYMNIKGKRYDIPAGRLALLLHTGNWCEECVLYRDNDRFNFKINNLMSVSKKQHSQVLSVLKNLQENCKVIPHPVDQYKFIVHFVINGKSKNKVFHCPDEARVFLEKKKKQLLRYLRRLGCVVPQFEDTSPYIEDIL